MRRCINSYYHFYKIFIIYSRMNTLHYSWKDITVTLSVTKFSKYQQSWQVSHSKICVARVRVKQPQGNPDVKGKEGR